MTGRGKVYEKIEGISMLLTEEMCEGKYTKSDTVEYKGDKILILFNDVTGAIKLVALGAWTFSHVWNFGVHPSFLERLKVVIMDNPYWEGHCAVHSFKNDQIILGKFLSQQLKEQNQSLTQEE